MFYDFSEVVCLNELSFEKATTTTTLVSSTTQPETTTTVEASTTSVAAALPAEEVDDPGDPGGGFPWIIVLIGVGLLALLIYLLREQALRAIRGVVRGASGGGEVDGPDGPAGPEGPHDPGKPETPLVSIPRTAEPIHKCDWAFYVVSGAPNGRYRVRDPQPGSRECCVYELTITTLLSQNDTVAKERQDVPEEGREHASVGGNSPWGVGARSKAGVRSWPFGEQGALHGLGDMSEWPIVGPTPGPWPEYWQERQFEEQLDVAFTTRLHQETTIEVMFNDGCGGSKHEYDYRGDSWAQIVGTAECTNENHLPACPVELTVSALVRVSATGDCKYWFDVVSLTDTDELPPKIVAAGPNMEYRRAEADGHRHDTDRERTSWLAEDSDTAVGSKADNRWTNSFVAHFEADAGLMIPQAMWPTTDRVTALVEVEVSNQLRLGGTVEIGHSPKSVCCADGAGRCLCDPKFSLEVGPGNVAKLHVDGKVVDLSNPDPTRTGVAQEWSE